MRVRTILPLIGFVPSSCNDISVRAIVLAFYRTYLPKGATMSKFPILLIAGGLLIAILGCAITGVVYAIQVSQSFNSTMDLAGNSDAEAAKLCHENEKLVSEKGPS